MRRVMLALFATLAGTTLLVGLKSQGFGAPLGLSAEAPLDPANPDGIAPGDQPSGPAGPASTPGTTSTPGQTPKPGTTTRPGSTPTTTSAQPGATATTTTPPPTSRTFTGAYIAVKTAQSPTPKSSTCGECHAYSISVTITVSGSKITKASVAYNTSPAASLSYASRANNTLSQAILSAQTWNLGRVSGATYSGNAWELSVKDAMAKAGLPT